MAKLMQPLREVYWNVLWSCNRTFILLLLLVPQLLRAEPIALFWHAATFPDTLLVERIAPKLAQKLSTTTSVLMPDEIAQKADAVVFEDGDVAEREFARVFPNVSRIDLSIRRFGNSASIRMIQRRTRDSLRLLYSGQNEEIADWMEFYLYSHLVKSTTQTAKSGFGVVEVDGSPSGAAIFVDGVATGKSVPARLEQVSAGERLIELRGAYRAARMVNVTAGTVSGLQLKGRVATSLIEVISDPPGLAVEIDSKMSGYTPYIRESIPGGFGVTIGGGEREQIVRFIDVEAGEWKTIYATPQLMHRVVVNTIPPGAAIYAGPVRLGSAGDTLPCPPSGAEWTADHPYANPKIFTAKGAEGRVTIVSLQLPPASALVKFQDWIPQSTLKVNGNLISVTNPDRQLIPAGPSELFISTPGYRSRKLEMDLMRGEMYTVNSDLHAAPAWESAAYSIALPGLGQLRDGDRIRASVYFIPTVVSLAMWVSLDRKLVNDIHAAETAESKYQKAVTATSASVWASQADTHWSNVDQTRSARNSWVALTFAVWTFSVVDRIVLPSRPIVPAQVGDGIGLKMIVLER